MTPAGEPDLPVQAVVADLLDALGDGHGRTAVLSAPPGAGKTTGVPPALLDAPWLTGTVVLTQPRRLAARVVARRLAHLLGTRVGDGVGLVTGGEVATSRRARVEVVTEGVLLQRLLRDPGLTGVGAIVLDEVHERSTQVDLALALCAEVADVLRDDLRLLAMSATLVGIALERVLPDAVRVHAEGRRFEVTDHWHPRPPTAPLGPAVAEAVGAALDTSDGDVLVFLPGRGDIRRARAALGRLPAGVVVHDLHGGVLPRDQDAALRPDPDGRRRVVLSTSVAETSLTVDGVTAVVDAGLRREARVDPRSGLTRLTTVPCSRAEAEQRRGRAGRLAPGHCHHLYGPSALAGRPEQPRPGMRSDDLTDAVLTIAAWGAAPADLRLLDDPPPHALATARRTLTALGVLEPHDAGVHDPARQDRLSALGEAVVRLPVDARLAVLLLSARSRTLDDATATEVEVAATLAALLREGDVLRDVDDVDVALRLDALDGRGTAAGRLDRGRAERVRRTAGRLLARLDDVPEDARLDVPDVSAPDGAVLDRAALVARLAARAFPERVGEVVRERDGQVVRLAAGRTATLSGAPTSAPFVVALDVVDSTATGRRDRGEARVFLAVDAELEDLLAALPERTRWRDHVAFEPSTGQVRAERRRSIDGLVLQRGPLTGPPVAATTAALLEAVRHLGLRTTLRWSRAADELQARAVLLARQVPDRLPGAAWPDLTDDALVVDLGWLAGFLHDARRVSDLRRVDGHTALLARFDHAQRTALDRLAPTHLTTPAGARHRLAYPEPGAGGAPVLAAKLQEFLGTPASPTVADGRVAVVLHLLSPADRPLQVTADLAAFWRDAYPAVRGEMRGRYPKHRWPEDPVAADPSTRTLKRLRRR